MSAIFTALSKFHEEVGKIKKSSTNPHFKNKYADVNTVLDAIREPLKKAGLCFVQLPQQGGLKTILATTEGDEQIESFLEYELSKKDMQGLGSAITYARRYALVSMLGLEAEDDDGNEASKPEQTKPANVKPEPTKPIPFSLKLTSKQKQAIDDLLIVTDSDIQAFNKIATEQNWTYEEAVAIIKRKLPNVAS